jgi:hypothetical protein
MHDRMNDVECAEYADQIYEAQLSRRQERRARRYRFWEGLADLLLSIPPGIAVRLGG